MACPHQHHRADPCPTGYVSYAYSLEEVDQMTRELRKKSKQPIPEGASDFEKFQTMAYSAAMKGLYIGYMTTATYFYGGSDNSDSFLASFR